MKRTLLQTTLAMALPWLLAGAALAQPVTLRAWNIHPDGYPVTEALKSFAEEIAQTTGGRYRVELHSNGVLGDQPKAVDMLKSGEIELAEFSSGALTDAVPGLKALNTPFLFTNSEHMFKYLDGKLGKNYAEKLASAGYVVLGWYDGGSRSFYCNNRTLVSANDLKGARIRVQQSETWQQFIKLLDAEPVAVPFKEVLGAFEKGLIDCAENNLPAYEATGHYKVAPHVFLTNHVVSAEMLVISAQTWNKMSDQDQTAFRIAGKRSALLMRELWRKRQTLAVELTTKQGAQFVRIRDAAPFLARMRPLYKRLMDDPVTREEVLTVLTNN